MAVGLALVGYIGYLIVAQYYSQVALRATALKQLAIDSERHAMALGYFFKEREKELTNMAASREVTAYFENKALGMSMEYGLRASLIDVEGRFRLEMARNNLDGAAIYRRIVFVDRNGKVLVESRGAPDGWGDDEWRRTVAVNRGRSAIFWTKGTPGGTILLCAPTFFKGRYAGQIVAWLSCRQVYDYFFHEGPDGGNYPVALLYDSELVYVPPTARRLLPSSVRGLLRRVTPGEAFRFLPDGKERNGAPRYGVLSPVGRTPFALLTLIPATEQFDQNYPGKLLFTTGGVALFILIGTLLFFRLHLRNEVLQAHLRETRLREQEVAGKNRQLEEEFAERRRVEEEVRLLNTELEQRVKSRTAELEASNNELEAFCYSVSHDLRGPLTRLEGFGEALEEDYADRLDEQGRDYIHRLTAASVQLKETIDALLDLSRLTRREMVVNEVDLSDCVRSIGDNLQRGDPQRPVDLIVAPGVKVTGDPRLLRVLMENLLGNAWKFTGKTDRPRIEFGADGDGQKPVYFLRDNGAGFDMRYAAGLFKPFHRLHGPTEFAGTGIGLATVYRIVQRHGGRVWAESSIGHGATFYFTL